MPFVRTSRLGSASASSHGAAFSPRTIVAVLAMFASTHELADTLTVRHTLSADRPVSGSIRWWAVPVSVRH